MGFEPVLEIDCSSYAHTSFLCTSEYGCKCINCEKSIAAEGEYCQGNGIKKTIDCIEERAYYCDDINGCTCTEQCDSPFDFRIKGHYCQGNGQQSLVTCINEDQIYTCDDFDGCICDSNCEYPGNVIKNGLCQGDNTNDILYLEIGKVSERCTDIDGCICPYSNQQGPSEVPKGNTCGNTLITTGQTCLHESCTCLNEKPFKDAISFMEQCSKRCSFITQDCPRNYDCVLNGFNYVCKKNEIGFTYLNSRDDFQCVSLEGCFCDGLLKGFGSKC